MERHLRRDWESLPYQLRRFVLDQHQNCISLNDLVKFWSNPTMAEYTRGSAAKRVCDALWSLAKEYLPISSSKARALTLNGSFLRQCLV